MRDKKGGRDRDKDKVKCSDVPPRCHVDKNWKCHSSRVEEAVLTDIA